MTKQSVGERLFQEQLDQAKLLEGCEPEYQFALPRKWRFDFCWPDLKLAVEIEGGTWIQGRHSRGKGFEKDAEKYNTAAMLGWLVLRFTTRQVTKSDYALRITSTAIVRQRVKFRNRNLAMKKVRTPF